MMGTASRRIHFANPVVRLCSAAEAESVGATELMISPSSHIHPAAGAPHEARGGRFGGAPRLTQPVTNAFLGMVSGRSTELRSPGSAATTYGTAFTTRNAVAT